MEDYLRELFTRDAFNELEFQSALLYIALCLNCDKEAIVGGVRTLAKSLSVPDCYIQELIQKGFIKKAGDIEYELTDYIAGGM